MAPKGGPVKMKPVGQAYKDKSKPADVRSSNISAAKGKKVEKIIKIQLTSDKTLTLLSFP